MITDLERRVTELRVVDGVEKVERVPYRTGDQFWVRFNRPLDLERLTAIVKKRGYMLLTFGTLPSKLPRGLAELLSDGITHIIAKEISAWSKFTAELGFEPEGIAKLAVDLHGQYQIFIATGEDGIQLLYEYLGMKYLPPTPPPAATAPARPAAPTVPKTALPAPPPAVAAGKTAVTGSPPQP